MAKKSKTKKSKRKLRPPRVYYDKKNKQYFIVVNKKKILIKAKHIKDPELIRNTIINKIMVPVQKRTRRRKQKQKKQLDKKDVMIQAINDVRAIALNRLANPQYAPPENSSKELMDRIIKLFGKQSVTTQQLLNNLLEASKVQNKDKSTYNFLNLWQAQRQIGKPTQSLLTQGESSPFNLEDLSVAHNLDELANLSAQHELASDEEKEQYQQQISELRPKVEEELKERDVDVSVIEEATEQVKSEQHISLTKFLTSVGVKNPQAGKYKNKGPRAILNQLKKDGNIKQQRYNALMKTFLRGSKSENKFEKLNKKFIELEKRSTTQQPEDTGIISAIEEVDPDEPTEEEQEEQTEEEQTEEEQEEQTEEEQEESEQSGEGKKSKTALYSNELEYMMRRYKRFKGVFSVDNFDKVEFTKGKDFGIIVNTDKSDQPGEHWVALYIDNPSSIMYYDSYGDKPSKEFMKTLKRLVEKIDNNLYMKLKYNLVKHQSDVGDYDCGFYAMNALLNMFKGVKYKKWTKYQDIRGGREAKMKLKDKFGYI